MYKNKAISEYLKELSSKAPIPGGGSAAALVGAVGASLIAKVANFTIGKEKYKDFEKEVTEILAGSKKMRDELHELCSEDAKAYKTLSEAFKLPKDAKDRTKKVQDALKAAMSVPLDICRRSHEAMKLCEPLADKGNVNLITDVGDAVFLLDSAFQAALLNVEINLKYIKDKDFIINTRKILQPLEEDIKDVKKEVLKTVEEKMK